MLFPLKCENCYHFNVFPRHYIFCFIFFSLIFCLLLIPLYKHNLPNSIPKLHTSRMCFNSAKEKTVVKVQLFISLNIEATNLIA